MMQYLGFTISRTEDCDENTGGYFCQVYTDEGMEREIDNFCIEAEDFCDEDEVDDIIREKIRDSFDEYLADLKVRTSELFRSFCELSQRDIGFCPISERMDMCSADYFRLLNDLTGTIYLMIKDRKL